MSLKSSEFKATSEVVFKAQLSDLGISSTDPVDIDCDNTKRVPHERTKHIEVALLSLGHFVREKQTAGRIRLPYISSELHLAYIFTKAMSRDRHLFLVSKLSLVDQYSRVLGGVDRIECFVVLLVQGRLHHALAPIQSDYLPPILHH